MWRLGIEDFADLPDAGAGEVLLANADLKDKSNLRDLQDSALIYKNAVFHFVRVDV